MANETIAWAGSRGRHRSPGILGRAVAKATEAMRNLAALPPRWRFLSEPFELAFAIGSAVSGALVTLGVTRPESLVVQLSPWLVRGWGLMLLAGAAATLGARVRMARARTDQGLIAASRLEVIGMLLFATVLGVYGLGVMALGSRGLAVGPMAGAWAMAFAVRARILVRQIAELDLVLRTGTSDG